MIEIHLLPTNQTSQLVGLHLHKESELPKDRVRLYAPHNSIRQEHLDYLAWWFHPLSHLNSVRLRCEFDVSLLRLPPRAYALNLARIAIDAEDFLQESGL